MTAPNRLKPVDYIEDIIIAHDVNYFYQRYDSGGGQLLSMSTKGETQNTPSISAMCLPSTQMINEFIETKRGLDNGNIT